MEKPKINELKENKRETEKIRKLAEKTEKIKVTFYLDKDIIARLKELAAQSNAKYQTLLNSILKEALVSKSTYEERIRKLEIDIQAMKEKLAKVA